jgi:LPS-assembly protein
MPARRAALPRAQPVPVSPALHSLRRSPRSSARPALRLAPVALACAALQAGAQTPGDGEALPELRRTPALQGTPRGDAATRLPIILRAREIRGRPDLETVAEGEAEFRRGGVLIRADRLSYDYADDLAVARGHVEVRREGNVYRGPELQLNVQRFEGFFLTPSYEFSRIGAGGSAQRIDFLDEQRAVATGATYSSCPSDGSGGPDWLLSTRRVKLDFEANEGIAEGAVLRFLGVPILAAPVLSFPLTDARKSGWLPPSINLDSKSGLQVSVPYYWNIAPNRDATLTPLLSAKRGAGGQVEYRYLEPHYNGSASLDALPKDQLTGTSRYALNLVHDSALPNNTELSLRVLRVSDDDYWKDFPRGVPTLTPRLLATDLQISRPLGDWQLYARMQRWQVLQGSDEVQAPYERVPQVGARWAQRLGPAFELALETELNRFETPPAGGSAPRPSGVRLHALASLARPFGSPGWTVTPRLLLNAASYALDEPFVGMRRRASRLIPTISVDSAWVLERETQWFGRAVRQTLEPRLLYVNTPFRPQSDLPNFDAAAKDFSFESIFTENAFAGIDRVSDAHQVTAGVTSRFLDSTTGAEALRLGVVQRYLFRDQRITPNLADPYAGVGEPLTQRLSEVLLLGSTSLLTHWNLDAAVQYSPDIDRKSVV